MFRPKKVVEFSLQRVSKKLLNDRESNSRIKHLRTIIDNVSPDILKSFLTQNYSLIFNAFYDVFTIVHGELLQKVNSSHYKELQNILLVLEKIFICLPELIHQKWQFNCICSIIKSLLHSKNIFKIRLKGLKLFLLWFQILNTEAPIQCYEIFISLVPVFHQIIKTKIYDDLFKVDPKVEGSIDESNLICDQEIRPVMTQNVEKEDEPENINQHLLRYFLRFISTEGIKVMWNENCSSKRFESHNFLFEKFKKFYLPVIFPKCSEHYTLEKNQAMLMSLNELDSYYKQYETYLMKFEEISIYQVEVIIWISELSYNYYFSDPPEEMNLQKSKQNFNTAKSLNIELFLLKCDNITELHDEMRYLMRRILFESTENVNIINQLFQHSFYLPIKYYKVHFCVLSVYQSWLFSKEPPRFMLQNISDSITTASTSTTSSCLSSSGSIKQQMINLNESINQAQETYQISLIMQRVIFTNIGVLFLHNYNGEIINDNNNTPSGRLSPKRSSLNITNVYPEIVRKAIEVILRKSINSISNLDSEHLMHTLLDIGFKVLTNYTPENRPPYSWISHDVSLGQFFQTLNVLLLKANLTNYISEDLWNKYLVVYTKLTNWQVLIVEWKKTLELLVRLMGRYLYKLDLSDLPLDRIERYKLQDKKSQSILKNNTKTMEKLLKTDNGRSEGRNTMNFNSTTIVEQINDINSRKFMDSLHHNDCETIQKLTPEKGEIKQDEISNNIEDLNRINAENDGESGGAYSSHDENSSYVSAEESSSPHYKDRNQDFKSEFVSDNEQVPMSSSGGDTSFEGNESFDNGDLKETPNEIEDINDDDADDEDDESSCNDNERLHQIESKSATLTREESDIDSPVGVIVINNPLSDESKTPTKTFKRKAHTNKRVSDRNSMNIEENINLFADNSLRKAVSTDNINTHHICIRGTSIGWSEESVVILWKRVIGLLGNITVIENKENLHMILDFLDNITNVFVNMRKNMGVSASNKSLSTKPPHYVPPIECFVSWLFQILKSETHDIESKLKSLRTLCTITVRRHDMQPSIYHLTQFYKLIHQIIHCENKELISALINDLGVHFLTQPLAGSEVVIGDLLKAADIILKDYHNSKVPKIIILTMLSQILQILKLSSEYQIFDPDCKELKFIKFKSIYKKTIIDIIIDCVRKDESSSTRIFGLKILTNICYVEIINSSSSLDFKEYIPNLIYQLLGFLRFDNSQIALIATDMIRVLVNCASQLIEKLPQIPEKIIQTLCWSTNYLWLTKRRYLTNQYQRLLTSLIFALLEWCMVYPVSQLIDGRRLIHSVFSTLQLILNDDFDSPENAESTTYNEASKRVSGNLMIGGSSIGPSVSTGTGGGGGGGGAGAGATCGGSSVNSTGSHNAHINSSYNSSNISYFMEDPLCDCQYVLDISPIKEVQLMQSKTTESSKVCKIVKLTARAAMCHLINHLGHFPRQNSLESLSSCVLEHHDMHDIKIKNVPIGYNDLSSAIFESDSVNVFVINGSMIMTLLALNEGSELTESISKGKTPVLKMNLKQSREIRVIIRDLCGKYCWDMMFIPRLDDLTVSQANSQPPSPPPRRNLPSLVENRSPVKQVSISKSEKDNVNKLLDELNDNSAELFCSTKNKQHMFDTQFALENNAKKQINELNNEEKQCFEKTHCAKISYPKLSDKKLRISIPYEHSDYKTSNISNLYYCRQILTQLGFLSWKRRSSIDVINKQKCFRELKALDKNTKCRDTHKIAILYVDWAQEDKESILSNQKTSLEFQNFISDLGWPVNLEGHYGFTGGLDCTGRNGLCTPYYSTSTLEIIFHVSTWMPSSKKFDNPSKFKHLGNDDVMIIWSENYRDYISKIAKTQFGEVMIMIYPLRNGLFRVQIEEKRETHFHGPLYNGAIVGEKELAGLVRSTAVNAGKAIREFKQHYQEYYLERALYLEKAIKNYKLDLTYEEFAGTIYGSPTETQSKTSQNESSNYIVDSNKNITQKNYDFLDKISPKTDRSQNQPDESHSISKRLSRHQK